MTDNVKYPSQPTYTATVANEEALLTVRKDNSNCGAKCFMTVVALVFVILGVAMTSLAIYTLCVLHYGGHAVLSGYSMATVYSLLTVGLVLLCLSIAVWVSSCKPNNCCSKFILTLFSVVMVVVFVAQVTLIVLGCLWLNSAELGPIHADELFNDTVKQVFKICCPVVNGTLTTASAAPTDLCDHIMGDNTAQDCASETTFYEVLVGFLSPVLTWVFAFLGVVAFLNIVAFACSCCLICSKSRSRAIYKPAVTYQNGV